MSEVVLTIAPVATAADLETAAGLFAAYAAALDIDLGYQDFVAELACFPGKSAPPSGEILLARDRAGLPRGCVALRPLGTAGCCEMKRLHVRPEARGLGLGRALVDRIITVAQSLGYSEMRLDTVPSMTGANALYRKAGFVPIEPHYETPIAGTLFLVRRLRAADSAAATGRP